MLRPHAVLLGSLAFITFGCGDGDSPGGGGSNGPNGANGANGANGGGPLQVLVPTEPEVEEDCAGAFDTSAPAVGDPATFTVDGDRVIVRGSLGPTSPTRLQAAMDDNPGLRTLVLANVPGTVDAVQSERAALMARAANLATCVPNGGYIASGGVDLFLAGAIRRIAPNNQGLVVHGWITEQCLPTGECPASLQAEGCVNGAGLPMDDARHTPFLEYLDAVGIDRTLYWWIFEQAPSFCDPLFMSGSQTEMWGFETSNACTDAMAGATCNQPPGQYTEACRSCFFDEPILSCTCDGGSGASSLDVSTCAGGPIDNCGGELACGDCEQVPLDLLQIEWDGDFDLDLRLIDPEGRTVEAGGVNETPNCAASGDATGGPGSVESVGCDAPLPGVYQAQVDQTPPAERRDFTFVSSKPASGTVSAPYTVIGTRNVWVLVGDDVELELEWTIHQNLELILVDEDTRRAVTPRGTVFDPLPGCTTSADNTGADTSESPHRETVSCAGLPPGNYQVEVQNPGGGAVADVGYTLSIGDGDRAIEFDDSARANTRDEHELMSLGEAGILDDAECVLDADCPSPSTACRVATCTDERMCFERNSEDGANCILDGNLGRCQAGTCRL